MAAEDPVKSTIDQLSKALSSKSIIGEPIELEDKIIIPVIKIGMGFGTGIARGAEEKNIARTTSGVGGGVGVFPVAIVIIFKDIKGPEGIRVMPLIPPSTLGEPLAQIASEFLARLTREIEVEAKKPEASRTASHATTVRVE